MDVQIRELLKKAKDGDEVAFDEVYQRYYRSVYIKAYQFMKNEADAKDVAQETFIEVHHSLKNLRELDSFYSWLMMVTASKCSKIYRKRKFSIVDIEDIENVKYGVEERVYMDPKKTNENNSDREVLLEIIESLTPKQAQVIKLIYFDELKLAEVAKRLDLPLGTVKTRAVKAREALKVKIKNYEKKEHCQLHFHANTIIPAALLGISLPQMFFLSMKEALQSVYQFVCKQSAITLCSGSMVGLVITGGTFLYEDYQEVKQSTPKEIVLPKNTFKSQAFQEETIATSREAYYTCMNFAQDEASMKKQTKEAFNEVKPIYESMKQSNSKYYQILQDSGWTTLFETNAY